MVGVPGRSKGCNTCKKRRKKCDLQRPICANCIRAKFECAGYERDMILIQVDKRGKGTYQPKRQRQPQQATAQWANVVPADASVADVRYKDLNRMTFEVECLAGFRNMITPMITWDGWSVNETKEPAFIGGWWGQIFQQPHNSDLVRCSLLAISAFYVGHVRHDTALRTRGIELYCQAVGLLRKELDPARLAKRNFVSADLELACYAVAMYEFYRQELPVVGESGSPATRFRKYYDKDELRFLARQRGHIGGVARLMSLQDPAAFAEPLRHHLFVQIRRIHITICIEKRQSTFLASKRWLTEPWKGRQKTYHDHMLDMMAHLPTVLETWEKMKSAPADQNTAAQAALLKRQCHALQLRLEEWHDVLSTACATFRGDDAEVLRGYIAKLAPEDLPEVLFQHSPWYLYAWAMYWSACITLYGIMPLIYLRFPPTATEHLINAPHSIGTYCLSIARSVRYFLRPELSGTLVEISIRVPAAFAQRALANPVLRATADPKLEEAESTLWEIGRTEQDLALRSITP